MDRPRQPQGGGSAAFKRAGKSLGRSRKNLVEGARVRCVLDYMKIVCRLLVAMAILTVGLVQVSLAAESNDLASVNESSNA